MVTMGYVWDRSTEVLRGRAGQLAGIAAPTLFLPGLIRDAVPLFAEPGSTGFAAAGGLIAIAAVVIAVWGQLALIATAIDPAATRADSFRRATARLPAALAVTIVAILVVVGLTIPFAVAIALSGADLSGMANAGTMPDLGGGTVAFVALYGLLLLVAWLVVTARLFLTNVVVLDERRGLGAFARSWRITRGSTWRILGVLLLYGIVLVVAMSAAQFITGTVLSLILGRTALVAFLTAAVGGVAATIFSVIATVFSAQLYVALANREPFGRDAGAA